MTYSIDFSKTWTVAQWDQERIIKRFNECYEKGICPYCGEPLDLDKKDLEK